MKRFSNGEAWYIAAVVGSLQGGFGESLRNSLDVGNTEPICVENNRGGLCPLLLSTQWLELVLITSVVIEP